MRAMWAQLKEERRSRGARAPAKRLVAAAALLGVVAAGAPALAQQRSLEVERWLEKPGVKLVVVEFYATWCKPCMEAVPKWKALHDKYRSDGLRLIVVSTRDAGGVCESPGWTPDEVVCDDDGVIADQFEANPLPAAYLWGWQGHLLASKVHVEDVEEKIEAWMAKAPRVDVQAEPVPDGAGLDADGLRDAVRAELQRSDKMVVVATEAERAALRELVRASLELGRDSQTACEVGKEVSANSLVRAVITRARRPRLQLKLLSAERGCLVAAGTTRWNADKAGSSISEAVADLEGELRRPTQFPWGEPDPDRTMSEARVEFDELRTGAAAGPRLEAETSFLFVTSSPAGASVLIDGREVGQTPFQDRVNVGKHTLELRLGELYAPVRKRIVVGEAGTKLRVELPKTYGVLTVRSEPPGAQIFIDGTPTGFETPHTFPKRKQGTHRVELRRSLYRSARAEVGLGGGKAETLDLTLAPNFGGLAVSSNPPGLEVVLDGVETGETTPHTFEKLQAGVHDVEVLGSGKRLGLQRPRVEVGKTAQAQLELVGYKGFLVVTAKIEGTPLEADVFLAGEKIGTTPLQKRLAPGRLVVAISGAGRTYRRIVTLEPGGQVELAHDFAAVQVPKPKRRTRRPAETVTTRAGGFDGTSPGWVALGFGAAAGLGSAITFALAAQARDEADTTTTVSGLEAAVREGQTLETAGIAAGAAAGGLALLGVIFHLLDDDGPAPTAHLTPDGQGGLVGVAGRF